VEGPFLIILRNYYYFLITPEVQLLSHRLSDNEPELQQGEDHGER
jgi:hypothetical protein